MRRVQPLAPQQSSDGARLDCGVGFSQDAPPVIGGEGPASGVGYDLRVWSRRGGRRGRDGEAEEIPLWFTLIPILALLSNYGQGSCLSYVGTEGRAPP